MKVWEILVVLVQLCFRAFGRTPLIVVGVDGYGYQLFKEYGSPIQDDNFVLPLKPVFPTHTFPNFYSIATGLYPAQHGVISNRFFNQKMKEEFIFAQDQHPNFNWFKGEPFWITAKKAGLRVYTDMWVATSASFHGIRPDFYSTYDQEKTFQEKVKDLVENMDADIDTRCDVYVLYTSEPDATLHVTDMNNKTELSKVIQLGEDQITLLKTELGKRDHNMVIVSDHGMTSVVDEIKLGDEIKKSAHKFYKGIFPLWYSKHGDDIGRRVETINNYMKQGDQYGVVAKDIKKFPKRYQMCGLARSGLPEIMFLVENHNYLDQKSYALRSSHGYDNILPDMHGMLRVSGPKFKSISSIKDSSGDIVYPNVELYNLFCSLLDIVPVNNAGNLETFDFMLAKLPDRSSWQDDYSTVAAPCGNSAIKTNISPCFLAVFLMKQLYSSINFLFEYLKRNKTCQN